MKSVGQIQRQGKLKDVRESASAAGLPTEEIDSTMALIQGLIPLGLQSVSEALEAEVVGLGWHPAPPDGWTPRRGPLGAIASSVYLADQKLPIPVPRVRDRAANREIPLTT